MGNACLACRGIVTTRILTEGYRGGQGLGDHIAAGLGRYSDQVFVKIVDSPGFF